MRIFSPLLVVLLCSATAVHADVYKITDADGNVHYTDTPPADETSAEKIEIRDNIENQLETGKTQEQIEKEYFGNLEKEQAYREQAWKEYRAKVAAARARLKTAESALEKAKEIHEGDTLATKTPNGTIARKSEAYKQRVKDAEDALKESQQALQKALSQRPKVPQP